MKQLCLSVVLVSILVGIPVTADSYPYDTENDDLVYVKLIFVGFPGNSPGPLINEGFHGAIIEEFNTYINSHSGGKLSAAPESGILFVPGYEFQGPDDVPTWEAECLVEQYQNTPDMGDWDSMLPDGYMYGPDPEEGGIDLSEAWIHSAGHASPLMAEILYKIWEAYQGLPNPFDGGGERGWDLFFMFQSTGEEYETPYAAGLNLAGGRPNVWVKHGPMGDLTSPEFFANLRVVDPTNPDSKVGGTGQRSYVFPFLEYSEAELLEHNTRLIAHEFGHTLGPPDGPPNLVSVDYCEERYYYGCLNLMCQHYIPGRGIPPIVDPFLLEFPWNKGLQDEYLTSVRDVTGMELHGEKIYDVRSGGQLLRIDLGLYCDGSMAEQEYFVFAYHAGNGIDAQDPVDDQVDDPLVRSQGLAIWHCIGPGGVGDIFDLESAVGLWDFSGAGDGVAVTEEYVWPHGTDIPEDRVSGFDNYDLWPIVPDPIPGNEAHYRIDYDLYQGDDYDFFRPARPGDPDSVYYRNEFSFNTNPSTYGYSRSFQPPPDYLRRRPQNVPNSLVIKVLETGTDENGDYMLVDILPAPVEEITFPIGGETFDPGDVVDITWEQEYADAITIVDIDYSRFGGESWTPLVTGYDPPSGVHHWAWTVQDSQATGETAKGLVRITYHNNISDDVASEILAVPFWVSGSPAEAEEIVFPGAGDFLYGGVTTTLRWTHNMSGPWQFELQWTHDGGENYETANELLQYSIDPETDQYTAEWTPGDEHTGSTVQFRLKCQSHALDITYGAWTTPVSVYPLGSVFSDVTADALDDPGDWYDGVPSGAIPIDFDADDLEDLLVTMTVENDEGVGAILYRNDNLTNGTMAFDPVLTDFAFQNDCAPPDGVASATCGDLDGDGDRELIIGMAGLIGETGEVGARIYRNDRASGFEDATDDYVAVFNQDALIDARSVSVIDYDHDGREDLFIAASLSTGSGGTGDIFLRNQMDGGGLTFRQFDWGLTQGATETAWTDTDGDGYWEFFCLEGGSVARYFEEQQENNNDPEFVDLSENLPTLLNPTSACWADLDHSNSLELVVATRSGGIVVVWGTSADDGTAFNAGSTTIPLPLLWHPNGIASVDHNQDGWCDLVVAGARDEDQPLLVLNLLGRADFDEPFAIIDERVGLTIDGDETSYGVVTADFDSDHDVDLVLPRGDAAGRAYQSGLRDGVDPPDNWIAFDFEPGGDPAGTSLMGSVVVVKDLGDNELGRRVLDGGRGPSGQDSGLVIIGLGDHTTDISYTVHMPQMDYGPYTASPGTTVTISAPPLASSVSVYDITWTVNVMPFVGLLEWCFQWSTDCWTPPENDQVHIWGTSCAFSDIWLDNGMADVEATVFYRVNATTGAREYVHQFVWTDQPCSVGCLYNFDVFSATNDAPPISGGSTTTSTGRIRICPQVN